MVKHFGKKTEFNGYKFDSLKERDFYQKFCEKYDNPDSEFKVLAHPSYPIIGRFEIGSGVTIRSAKYTPDVVITDQHGKFLHVYDVKNSFSVYGVDSAAKLRFKLFTKQYGIPVECIVPRKNDFKVKVFGTTKKTHEHIFSDINYDWKEVLC